MSIVSRNPHVLPLKKFLHSKDTNKYLKTEKKENLTVRQTLLGFTTGTPLRNNVYDDNSELQEKLKQKPEALPLDKNILNILIGAVLIGIIIYIL